MTNAFCLTCQTETEVNQTSNLARCRMCGDSEGLVFEEWIEIPGFGGMYEVSNFGDIRSYYVGSRGVSDKPSLVAVTRRKNGYPFVTLFYKGKSKGCYIHRLVAEFFVENPDNKPQVNHKDNDRENNFYLNLEWTTQAENVKHAHENGYWSCGEKRSDSKLTRKQVLKIRQDYKPRVVTMKILSEKYNVSEGAIFHVINRNTWKHL